jgi:hypothetical protein
MVPSFQGNAGCRDFSQETWSIITSTHGLVEKWGITWYKPVDFEDI